MFIRVLFLSPKPRTPTGGSRGEAGILEGRLTEKRYERGDRNRIVKLSSMGLRGGRVDNKHSKGNLPERDGKLRDSRRGNTTGPDGIGIN